MILNRLRILIVEDELVIAEDLKDVLKDFGYDVCGIAISSDEAFKIIDEEAPDLLFMDISIKGSKDGIELAADVNRKYYLPIIFLTSHLDLPIIKRLRDVRPFGFLVKPFNEQEIFTVVELAMANFKKEQAKLNVLNGSSDAVLRDSLFIRTNGMLLKVKMKNILYLEADANYTQINTKDKKFVIRSTLKELESKLDPTCFVRVHKSFLINLEEIEGIQADSVNIFGKEIPISRNQYSWLLSQIKIL